MGPDALAATIGEFNLRTADPENLLYQDWEIITRGRNTKFQGIRHESWEKATTEILRLTEGRTEE